jgi:hypothetical protein
MNRYKRFCTQFSRYRKTNGKRAMLIERTSNTETNHSLSGDKICLLTSQNARFSAVLLQRLHCPQ